MYGATILINNAWEACINLTSGLVDQTRVLVDPNSLESGMLIVVSRLLHRIPDVEAKYSPPLCRVYLYSEFAPRLLSHATYLFAKYGRNFLLFQTSRN